MFTPALTALVLQRNDATTTLTRSFNLFNSFGGALSYTEHYGSDSCPAPTGCNLQTQLRIMFKVDSRSLRSARGVNINRKNKSVYITVYILEN